MTTTCLCHCLFPAKLRVSNSVENPNEEYYTCMKRGSPRPSCKSFVWVQGGSLSSVPVASAPSMPTSRRQQLPTTPRTPRSPRAPTVAGLTAQVEELELDKERLEDECVQLKYELVEAHQKVGEALSLQHMLFLGQKAKGLIRRNKKKSKAVAEAGLSNEPSSSKRQKHNEAPLDLPTVPNDPY
ncbi:hypothetical protein BS47DRAFT_1361395 [Hydnum rufescens UP504]|uniref:Zinc finger GRF-type domain-containing protein n=1 Tax=Hydnum rufescens UP504 TaxID=1448309 RepID=A0A9P6AZR3_9AGAM|nr:hypothetical protein BS47DRAFT_1361395 [Hydnum rufescens UP504]